MMSHATQTTSSSTRRVVSAGGRPSVRSEERIAANMDVIAVTADIESEVETLLRAEGAELRTCQKLEHSLCESVCRTRAIHDRIVVLRADRRRENAAICSGAVVA